MPCTTTLKLPEELKERIAPLARQAGKTPHAWMLEALEREATLCELRDGFLQAGMQSAQEVDAGGPLYAAEDVHSYLRAKVAGTPARRPAPLKARRRR